MGNRNPSAHAGVPPLAAAPRHAAVALRQRMPMSGRRSSRKHDLGWNNPFGKGSPPLRRSFFLSALALFYLCLSTPPLLPLFSFFSSVSLSLSRFFPNVLCPAPALLCSPLGTMLPRVRGAGSSLQAHGIEFNLKCSRHFINRVPGAGNTRRGSLWNQVIKKAPHAPDDLPPRVSSVGPGRLRIMRGMRADVGKL